LQLGQSLKSDTITPSETAGKKKEVSTVLIFVCAHTINSNRHVLHVSKHVQAQKTDVKTEINPQEKICKWSIFMANK
jgi:hypothetical protein